jgi:hypothetical protein
MSTEEAHRDAFWVITVVGGMSVARAIEDSLNALSISHWTPENAIVLSRFVVFLLTSVRFYIGASVFFQRVHIELGHGRIFPARNYVVDFGSAIFHFSILYAVAANIKTVAGPPFHLSDERFFLALCFMLLYDWAWYLASTPYDTARYIRKWAWYNTIAVFIPCVAIFAGLKIGVIDMEWFEILVAAWIVVSSLPDLHRMSRGVLPE